ncbi:MAG: hypothetical protein ABIO71_04375 [Caldimonas sp.]
MRSRFTLLAATVFAAAIAAAGAASAAAALPQPGGNAFGTTQIFQQRTTDGRTLLTDRPYPTATIERAWQLEREDPAAARGRALEMRREAQAVSQRVQLGMDRQQRQLDDDLAARKRSVRGDAAPVGLTDVASDEILVRNGAYPFFFFGDRGRPDRRDDPRLDARADARAAGRDGRPSDRRFEGRIGSPPRRDPPLPRPRLRGSAEPESR